MIDFSQLEESFISAIGMFFDRLFENVFGFFDFIILFEDIGIAHDNSLIEGIFLIGKGVEVLGFIIVKLLELLLSHLEEFFKRETCYGFALLFVHSGLVFMSEVEIL